MVHEGRTGYVGKAVVAACRIVDSAGLRNKLAEHTDGDLVLAVTENLYEDLVDAGYAGMDARTFHQIEVQTDKFEGTAWVHLPPRGPVPAPDRIGQIRTRRIIAAAATGAAIGAVTVVLGEELAELLEDAAESEQPEALIRSSGRQLPDLDDPHSEDEDDDDGPELRLGGQEEDEDDDS